MNEDWRWQVRHLIRRAEDLALHLSLTDDEREGLSWCEREGLPFGVTPYYLSLINPDDPADPIRRQCVPLGAEAAVGEHESEDPLGEQAHEVAPFLVRRYPDRGLLVTTDRCATYCRHCTRRRRVGRGGRRTLAELEPAFSWLEQRPEVREVLISGGDPLIAPDGWLGELLDRLRRVPHLEVLRLGTRAPVTLPQRVTPALCRLLRRFAPLYVTTHFNHPRELTAEARAACGRLADAGIPLANQTVLLKGVNDCAETLAVLNRGLLRARVRPYYLMQCDAVRGTGHLRVSTRRGLSLVAALRGRVSGLALPTYVLDLPGGAGKIPLHPSYVEGWKGDLLVARGPRGSRVVYDDREWGDSRCVSCRSRAGCGWGLDSEDAPLTESRPSGRWGMA